VTAAADVAPPTALLGNWSGNVVYRAEHSRRPSSVAELQSVVAAAERLRAVGTGHSFNRIADTTGDLVSVAGLPPVLDVDADRRSVRVSAGTRYGELVGPLHAAGFALPNLGSLPHISIGGACSTGTHGSGVHNGTLASSVSAVELVTADGSLVRLSRADDPAVFDGAVIALGGLGVVTVLELDVQPTFDLRQYVYDDLPHATVRERYEEVVSAGYSVSLFSDWRAPQVHTAWRKLRTDAPDAVDAPDTWFGAGLADGPRHPIPGMAGDTCTEQLGVPGPWHARLPHFRLEYTPSSGQELQSEWFVRREDAVAALDLLADLREQVAEVLLIGELRTLAAEPLWMSPSAGRDTAALHFTWVLDEAAVVPVVRAIDDRLAELGARPHWAKVMTTPPERLRDLYHRYADFEALLRAYDPAGKLRNELLDEYFPGAR
jgi:xylitol oxidase